MTNEPSQPNAATHTRRTTKLSVTFDGGYAKAWAFKVGECFRPALDIKYTPYIDKKSKIERSHWTEGVPPKYAFHIGDLIHHSNDLDLSVQVQGILGDNCLSVAVYRHTTRESLLEMKQVDFVEMLKKGDSYDS
jgi:hypothetical protein